LLPGKVASPFLLDLSAHVRLLIALPLLVLGARVAEARILPTLQQFLTRKLIPEQSLERFQDAVASAFRLGDSIVADVLIIVLIYALDMFVFRRTEATAGAVAWRSSPDSPLSLAGVYRAYVSVPIFQFVLFRWYFRLFIWARFLAQVARLKLRLIPTNPDRVGGLGFLLAGTQAFVIFAMAHGTLLAGWLAQRVIIRGDSLTEFKGEVIAVLALVLCITLLPLLPFTRSLVFAKRRGILEYGALAARYVREFDDKWLRGKTDLEEPLVGSADVQSLADMGGSYDLVQSMRTVPLTPQMILVFAAATLVPVAPLLLTVMPLEKILNKLVGILF
jgi:hypothetical protein